MDSFDIFRQLTHGVRFSNGKTRKLKAKPVSVDSNKIQIKDEKIKLEHDSVKEEDTDEEHSYENGTLNSTIDYSSEYDSDIKIKDEIKSEDESDDENNINLLDNISFANKRKKTSKAFDSEKESKTKQMEINRIRNSNHIHVNGKKPPNPIDKFDQLTDMYKVSPKLIQNVEHCGYKEPTPIQMQSMPSMLMGRNILACAPTGSGKTAAFLLPIIRDLKGPKKEGFRALILCPTRELAKQTQRECLRLTEGIDFRIHIISKVKQAELKYGSKSSKKYDILITTPNRVCYLLNLDPPLLELSHIQWLILDEADKLFETGSNSFRDQFNKIFKACTSPNLKVALFSATHTNTVANWGNKNLKNLLSITIGQRNASTDLIDQELTFVGSESGKLLAMRDIIRKGLQPPVLVFVQSKDRAQQLFSELLYDGINVDVIHADRTQQQRDNVVRAFREGQIWILICTELMGRGIDFKGVNLVINYDFPPSTISYIHRIGRTGRAGRRGHAITFFTQNDVTNLRGIANIMKNSGCEVPEYMLAMKKLTKRDRRKMEKTAPEREPISTALGFKKKKKLKNQSKVTTESKSSNVDNSEKSTDKEAEIKVNRNKTILKRKINTNEKPVKKKIRKNKE